MGGMIKFVCSSSSSSSSFMDIFLVVSVFTTVCCFCGFVGAETTTTVKLTTDHSQPKSEHTSPSPPATLTDDSSEEFIQKCDYTLNDAPSETLYTIGTQDVLGRDLKYHFSAPESSSRCFLTREDLESNVRKLSSASRDVQVVNFWFTCAQPGTLIDYVDEFELEDKETDTGDVELGKITHNGDSELDADFADETRGTVLAAHLEGRRRQFDGNHYRFYDNFISYVKVPPPNCKLSMRTFHAVANMTDLRVAAFVGANTTAGFAELEQSPQLCEAFRNLVAMGIIYETSASTYFPYLSYCNGHLNSMVEVTFLNTNMESFPESVKSVMPNMRTLMMEGNSLTSPVEFPWKPGHVELPRNLSRTHMFNLLYSYKDSYVIEPHHFRNIYFFKSNRIANLTCFGLQGTFDFINFESNGMEWIAECVFQGVEKLQYLSLADNKLSHLPEHVFSTLTDLTMLDLQNNQLMNLHDNLFRNLRKLQKLNLAGNRLVVLQHNVFTSLQKLTDLTLSNNTLQNISDTAISRFSVDLQHLDLSNNTLTSFPVIVLLLQGLTEANLDHTSIEALDFSDIDRRTTEFELARAAVNPTGGQPPSLDNLPTPANPRTVLLRHSRLSSIVYYDSSKEAVNTFTYVMKFFEFHVERTPLGCYSDILNVTHQVQALRASGKLTGREPSLQHLRCALPSELRGRTVAELRDEETYSPLAASTQPDDLCPAQCACYIRATVNTVIVDCRNTGLSEMPLAVPNGTRELWLQNNTIRTVPDHIPYFSQLSDLRMSSTQLQDFPGTILQSMQNLEVLHLDDNLLTRLGPQLEHLPKLRQVRLAGNPFRCDCRISWLKRWILGHQTAVSDWAEIKCSTEGETKDGQTLTAVRDDRFVCPVHASLGQLAIPIAIPATLFAVILVVAVVGFLQRRQLKILLYIHTGLHPFDRDPPPSDQQKQNLCYDVVVCCSPTHTHWVLGDIVNPLEQSGLAVFFYSRDAWLGESTLDNVRRSVSKSRRLVVVLGDQWQKDHLLSTAVREGLSKCHKEMVHYMVLVAHGFAPKDIVKDTKDSLDTASKDLATQFIKTGRCIDTQDKHFLKRLLYEMPATKHKPKCRIGDDEHVNRKAADAERFRNDVRRGGDVAEHVGDVQRNGEMNQRPQSNLGEWRDGDIQRNSRMNQRPQSNGEERLKDETTSFNGGEDEDFDNQINDAMEQTDLSVRNPHTNLAAKFQHNNETTSMHNRTENSLQMCEYQETNEDRDQSRNGNINFASEPIAMEEVEVVVENGGRQISKDEPNNRNVNTRLASEPILIDDVEVVVVDDSRDISKDEANNRNGNTRVALEPIMMDDVEVVVDGSSDISKYEPSNGNYRNEPNNMSYMNEHYDAVCRVSNESTVVMNQQNLLCAPTEPAAAKPQNVFVWYSDTDLQFTLNNIVQPLEERGHQCVLQDRDFVLGAAIQENILNAAETCARSVFVLSNQTAENEWFTFTFHVTFERHLDKSRDHRFALVKRQEVDVTRFVDEVRQVVESSTVLQESDPWFLPRILQFVESQR